MAYEKTTWTSTTKLTTRLLNHLETQYDEFMSILSAHNHDDRYYTKSECDSKYYHTSHMGYGSGANADMLDGQHLSDIMASSLPIGTIVIWSGTDANIPSGWAICNGANGTPDLRDRFVMGSETAGDFGGSASATVSGTVTIGNTTLDMTHLPAHYHDLDDYYGAGGTYSYANVSGLSTSTTSNNRTTNSTGGGQAHNHSTANVTSNSFDCRPPYYALYYIMKLS